MDGSIHKGVDGFTCIIYRTIYIAGGMEFHRARSLTGKLSQVISESRNAIAKERNESARSKRVARKTGGRERGTGSRSCI
jgi:hypothetical protein